jgi:hypothetical protein
MKAAKEWGSIWPTIQDYIHENINHEMEEKYQTPEKKIKNLVHTHNQTPKSKTVFHP